MRRLAALVQILDSTFHYSLQDCLMRRALASIALSALTISAASTAHAQVAGATTVGIEVDQLQVVAAGWSVKKQILGKLVFNENSEKVGRIDDLIIAPDTSVSFVIVGAGGFVGVARHDVAIPIGQLSAQGDHLVLVGATKAVVKGMPAFQYAK